MQPFLPAFLSLSVFKVGDTGDFVFTHRIDSERRNFNMNFFKGSKRGKGADVFFPGNVCIRIGHIVSPHKITLFEEV